jgi:hypothetical protein
MLEKDPHCEHEIDKIAYAHEIAHQFPSRELFWLKELRTVNAQTILFVCGDIHLRTFPRLLGNEGIVSEIVRGGLGVDDSAIEYSAFQFAEKNKMFSETSCLCREKLPADL